MDFLILSRGTPAAATAEDDPALDEQHWTYMDAFADQLTARGPTLGPDRETWTGSMHVIDLSDPLAVQDFIAHEPYNCAGAYERHFIWRFTNLLDHSMWHFTRDPAALRFLVLIRATSGAVPELPSEMRERLVVYGSLFDLESGAPDGTALAIQVPTRRCLDMLLAGFGDVEIHDWDFGGRR
jgi:hypothetical protein